MATVVVVDDSPSDRQLSETLLKYGGHSVLLCPDAGSALEVIKSNKPDLIVTDLITPSIDGYELARAVRANASTAATPIIMVTAHFLEGEVRRLAAQIGIQKVLIKPYDPQVFLESVESALNDADSGDRRPQGSSESTFEEEHLRLVSSKLHETVRDLEVIRLNRSDLLATLGTEMQAHLDVLLRQSEALTSRANRKLDEKKQNELLTEINSGARHLMALVDDILELSRVDAGQNLLRIEDVSVADLVAAVLRGLEPLAAKKNIQMEAEASTAGRVPADLYKLTHIIAHLAADAILSARTGGRVALCARRTTEAVEISVSAARPGVGGVRRELASEELLAAPDSPTSSDDIMDVRMVLTKRYVELHGGTLTRTGKAEDVSTLTLPLKPGINKAAKTKLGVRLLRRQQRTRKPATIADRDDRFIDPYAISSIVADFKKNARPATRGPR